LEAFGSIWKHFEAFGSIWILAVFAILFELFGSIWKHLEAFGSIWILTVFAILHRFDTEKINQRKQSSFQMLPKQVKQFLGLTSRTRVE
jgi:hypothetical protein